MAAPPPPALTLVDGMSRAKLVLIQTPPPQRTHSIPLRPGPSQQPVCACTCACAMAGMLEAPLNSFGLVPKFVKAFRLI